MLQPRPAASVLRTRRDAVGVARLAARQQGAVSRAQLVRCGLANATIARWIAAGRLHRVHPGIYAVGHVALDRKGRLIASLLYAGRGAALSHLTAAWWWQLLSEEPAQIHVSVPRRRRSVPGVRVHRPRDLDPIRHRGLPVTAVARTLLDIAPSLPLSTLRRALAEADYRRLCDSETITAVLCKGHPGSGRLRAALVQHYPELAQTFSVLEERFLQLCERYGIPAPEVNVEIAGLTVDALWRDARLIVELDGHAAHGTPPAIERDRRRELRLRSLGYTVLRYTWAQVTQDPERVASDLRAALEFGRSASRRVRPPDTTGRG